MKKSLIVLITSIVCNPCIAQEAIISPAELAELRKNPDTSNAVIMEQGAGEPDISLKELEGIPIEKKPGAIIIEDPNNPGTFLVEGMSLDANRAAQRTNEGTTGGIANNLIGTPYTSLEGKVSAQAKYAGGVLDAHALALSANCNALESAGAKKTAVIELEGAFFVIPTKPGDLPANPGKAGSVGIHGVDINQNCVRDDIEHYIFNKYPNKDQERLRLNLYSHAIWLNFFLINPISEQTIQGIARQDIKTGKCIETVLGAGKGSLARKDLFAHLHNTIPRTERYFANMAVLRGFMIEENITGACL